MAKYSEKQRRNSIIGALGYDAQIRKAEEGNIENVIKSESHEEFSEQNLLRKIKTIEFFTLNELKQKLRHADWLEYVCFEPAISDCQKSQNNLLSSADNPVDQLLKGAFDITDVHDQVSINRILEEASSAHIAKITAIQHKIIQGDFGSHKQIKGKDINTIGLQSSLKSAVNPQAGQNRPGGAESAISEMNKAQHRRYEHIQNIDQLNLSLVKNYYSLRLLKSRDYKQKLLSLVNYFRAVQRILAFDLKEHVTREKSLGEEKDLIEPHYGRDGEGRHISKLASQTGPGKIFQINIGRKLDADPHDVSQSDPVTINCYKYNGLFNATALSTCPMLPKHHRTFGRPNLYESMSQEMDRKTKLLNTAEEMQCLMVKRDKILVVHEKMEVQVFNEFGQPIVYSEAMSDMVALEEELIKIGSYFINQHEYLQASTDIEAAMATEEGKMDDRPNARPSSMIDRQEIALDLLQCELDFQFRKVLLVEKLLESYEHIYDPLESVRCLQMIVDEIAKRPRINMEASFYSDSYDSENQLLDEKIKFFTKLTDLQTSHEKEENKQAFDFQEQKVTKVSESIREEYKLMELEKTAKIGSNEADPNLISDEQFRIEQKIAEKLANKAQKKEALKEIQKKHITEYANEQYTNFAQVLGLPEICMEDLVATGDQKESIIQDSIREQAFFTKQLEGYPVYFTNEKFQGSTMGLHTEQVGLLDFYESLTVVPKVNASLFQAFAELKDALKPENGLAESLLELYMMQEANLQLIEIIRIYNDGGQETQTRGQNYIEEDFYFANSDKMLLLMKEFKSQMDPANLYKTADPLVVSKLDMKSVKNYNFPRIDMGEVTASLKKNQGQFDQDINDQLVRRMIELAKESSARQLLEKRDHVEVQCDDDDDDPSSEREQDRTVRSPSMLRMACNTLEVIRLREELIQRISECNELQKIYLMHHSEIPGKQLQVKLNDSINFNTKSIENNQINIVDSNHGLNKQFDLPFTEFDNSLSINLDFKSDSCIKALMTDLGVEELRAILHYQIMQQQLLTVAVKTNQLLIDGPMKGLKELRLLKERDIVVPNSFINIHALLLSATDDLKTTAFTQEVAKLTTAIKECQRDYMYNIMPKKNRDRETVLRKFQKIQTRIVQDREFKPELCLRVLRSYRIKLLHEFCQNVLKEVYVDSIKMQTLKTGNVLRLKACLLPISDTRLFNLGRGGILENMSSNAKDQLHESELEQTAEVSVRDILSGQIVSSSLFYVPHSEEILQTDPVNIALIQERQQAWLDLYEQDVLLFDIQIKEMMKRPRMLNETFQPGITHLKEQTQQNERKHIQVLPQNRVMATIQQLSGSTYKRQEETLLQMYKIENSSRQKFGFRKVIFAEANDYGGLDIFRLLEYMTLILRIFTLEYLMGRNSTPGRQLYEMEQKVMSGREFWTSFVQMKIRQDVNMLKFGDHSDKIRQRLVSNETAADRVIDRILDRKRVQYELSEDMLQVQARVSRLDKLAKDLPHEKRTIYHLIDLLILQHQATFYHFLNGLENILEIYRDKLQDENFYKVMEVRDMAIKRKQGLILNMKNGFYVSQASIHPAHISLHSSDVNEFAQFMQQYHPVIDERALIPKQVNMIQRIYGISSDLDATSYDIMMDTSMCNYAELQNIFYNLNDKERSIIGMNFPQIDEIIKDFLVYKGILQDTRHEKDVNSSRTNKSEEDLETQKANAALRKGQNYMSEYLLATVEILSFKLEAAHMQRILMGWLSGEGKIPSTTKDYTNLLRKYQDMTTLKILEERQHLNDIYFSGDRPQQEESKQKQNLKEKEDQELKKRDRMVLLEPGKRKAANLRFFDKVNEIRAESNVIKQLLDQKLIQIATRMITNEHSALSAAIDQAGSQELIQEFVHPQQQFASTLLQDVDKLSHLDIVNKIGFVQQFLTRLRNRCTEVETLTSGPGIVFSIKDFNECLSIFCKQMLKYSEENLRQRTETSAIMGNQYRHIIYLKDMEIIYYRQKCEQFLRNIDVIVNSKMSAKGNQIIYELDVTNRELRSLKDHYYLMEKYMREEIKKEFLKDLHLRDNTILKLKDDFSNFREHIQTQHMAMCDEEANEINLDQSKMYPEHMLEGMREKLGTRAQPTASETEIARQQAQTDNYPIILGLQDFQRKYKAMILMKQVITEQKHQKEIKEMELKLTLNASLWEQLSESQKRESITRQELELTKRNLTHYEKLIERLYIQLEQLNNEKVRLQRYKSEKQKKMSELESKMKDLEILENIDLEKILQEMRSRDKKIERLQQVDDEFNNRLESQEVHAANQIRNIEKLLAQERDAKQEAFAKLESMRIEMKALEGTDIKNDLWKDKCKELYEISKDLELENDGLRAGLKQLTTEKLELIRVNEQLIQRQNSANHGLNMKGSGVALSSTDQTALTEGQLQSATSRNATINKPAGIRENMILNRKALVKPLTAKANSLGQKRAQSGHPGAAKNRLYPRNMLNAQSYHYERGQIGASTGDGGPIHQTIYLSNNTSYPAFSSDQDINSLGQPLTGKNLMVGGANVAGLANAGKYHGTRQGHQTTHRYSATGTHHGGQPQTKMPSLAQQARKPQGAAGFTQSTRIMGQNAMGGPGVGVNSGMMIGGPAGSGLPAPGMHGVLSSNVIGNNPSNFTGSGNAGKNSGIALGQMQMPHGGATTMATLQKTGSNRLHTSQGQASNSRSGTANSRQNRGMMRGATGGPGLTGTQIGVIGSTMHLPQGQHQFVAAPGDDIAIDSKQIALSQANMLAGIGNSKDNMDQQLPTDIPPPDMDLQQLQGHLQNQNAVAQFTHGGTTFNNNVQQ